MSRTEKASKVRDYYVILFKFIDYYKNEISEAIMENIVKGKGYIYILFVKKGKFQEKDLLKIGRSQVNKFRGRLRQYQTGKHLHLDVRFIMIVDDPLAVKNCTKTLMNEYKYGGGQKYINSRKKQQNYL